MRGTSPCPLSVCASQQKKWRCFAGSGSSYFSIYSKQLKDLVGGFKHLEKYEFVNGKDYPIYYGK